MQPMQAEPGMRQQNVYMPPMRTENMDKKPVEIIKKKIVEIVNLPDFPKDKMKSDQKNVWIALIILFIVVGFIVMHKTKMI
jgi:hypothetical protein